jgi:hypothetical protein
MLCVVKRVPCRVLEARMSPVMDGRVVSRPLLHERQPRAATYLPHLGRCRITRTCLVALLMQARPQHHPIPVTS